MSASAVGGKEKNGGINQVSYNITDAENARTQCDFVIVLVMTSL